MQSGIPSIDNQQADSVKYLDETFQRLTPFDFPEYENVLRTTWQQFHESCSSEQSLDVRTRVRAISAVSTLLILNDAKQLTVGKAISLLESLVSPLPCNWGARAGKKYCWAHASYEVCHHEEAMQFLLQRDSEAARIVKAHWDQQETKSGE